jgi:CHAT domain-containing protein
VSLSSKQRAELDRVIPRLLLAETWKERQELLDRWEHELRTDEALGVLAVIRQNYEHDRRFQERVDAIRMSIDEARDNGHVGVPRPLARYFEGLFADGAPLGMVVKPASPPPVPAEDEAEAHLVAVADAFIRARAWRERRHIAAAYPEHFRSGQIEAFLAQLREVQPGWRVFYDCLITAAADARQQGHHRDLFVDGPLWCFLRGQRDRDQQLLTEAEAIQFAVLAFTECPTWERRRELLQTSEDLLLSQLAFDILEHTSERYPKGDARRQRFEIARDTLAAVRTKGIEAVFAAQLQPTQVRAPQPRLPTGAGAADRAERVSTARSTLFYLDPALVPWSSTAVNVGLAEALIDFPALELRPIYVEEALGRVQDALAFYSETTAPEEWRHARAVLGRAYLYRERGDRSASLEAAIKVFEDLLDRAAGSGPVEDTAGVETSLALAYRARLDGVRALNLEHAYSHACEAVELWHRSGSETDRAWAEYTLGTICAERVYGDDSTNLEEAIEHLTAAAIRLEPADDAAVWLGVQHALGGIYTRRTVVTPEQNLKQAIHHLEQGLQVAEQLEAPWQRGTFQHALATAHFRLKPTDAQARARAVELYKAALGTFAGDAFPSDRRRTLRELGAVYFREHRWGDALSVLEEAIELGDYLEASAYTQAGRFAETAELPDVYARRSYCLLQVGRRRDALVELDSGQARLLRDALPEVSGEAEVAPELRDELDSAILELRELTWATEASVTGSRMAAAKRRVADARHAVREALEQKDDSDGYDWKRLVPAGGALVVPLFTSEGSAVFVLTDDDDVNSSLLSLETVTDQDLRAILDPTPQHPGWLQANARWIHAYTALAEAEAIGSEAGIAEAEAAHAEATSLWSDTLDSTCKRLWDLLLGPIAARLQNRGIAKGARVVVIPSKWLALLPLHAAWHPTPAGREYFLDRYAVVYVPSVRTLAVSHDRWEERKSLNPSLLAIVDPSFRHVGEERDPIAALFAAQAFTPEPKDSTADRIASELPGRTHLHFSCHGSFNWLDPLASGLDLPTGDTLTLREISSRLQLGTVRLVTLSACESGVTEANQLPTEFVGLPFAFLQAGAASVVGSLWSVDAESTSELIEVLYQRHIKGCLHPAEALREAQLAVKQHYDFSHPFYWSAFVAVGG